MDDKLTLYSFWRSQASYRVRIALSLKGSSAELRTIDLLKGEQHHEDYRAINPEGLVPALIEGDEAAARPVARHHRIYRREASRAAAPAARRSATAPMCAAWRRWRRWTRIR